eukprot:2268969-Amphidinium_carterae.1
MRHIGAPMQHLMDNASDWHSRVEKSNGCAHDSCKRSQRLTQANCVYIFHTGFLLAACAATNSTSA